MFRILLKTRRAVLIAVAVLSFMPTIYHAHGQTCPPLISGCLDSSFGITSPGLTVTAMVNSERGYEKVILLGGLSSQFYGIGFQATNGKIVAVGS